MSRALKSRSEGASSEGGWYVPLPALGAHGWAAIAALILATRPFFDLLWATPHWPLAIDALWGVASILVLGPFWRAQRFRWLPDSLRQLPWLWLVLVVALTSCLWSLDPALTLRKTGWLLATTLVALAIGQLLAPRALMGVLFWVFCILLAGGLATAVLFPDYGTYHGRWKGTTPNHIDFGLIAAAGVIFFLLAFWFGRLARPVALLLAAVALVCLVGSQSSTAIVGVIVGFAVALSFIVGRGLRLPAMVVAVLVPIGLLAVAAIGLVYWEVSTELLNEDVTANGRTPIWADAIKIIEHRPLIGYGYGAVWGLYNYSFFPELETLTWASHAHDGYLQVASQLGLPTLALAALFLIHTLARAAAGYLRWSSSFALFATSYGFMFLVLNISEARLLEQGLFEWLLFVALATALARAAAETGRRPGSEVDVRRRSGQRSMDRAQRPQPTPRGLTVRRPAL